VTDDVAMHEAGHAAMALLLGVPLLAIDVVGNERYAGWVTHGIPEDGVRRALVILGGLLQTRDSHQLAWPIDPDESTDHRHLAEIIARWRIDRQTGEKIVTYALRLASSNEYWQYVSSITGVLDHHPVLDGRLLDALERSLASGRG
jgi:hypothetical protein